MKTTLSNRLGIALVSGVALASIVLSQVAFAQRGRNPSSGVSALIGRGSIRPSDDRFQPAAAMFLNEASKATPGKGGTFVSQTVMVDAFDRYLINIPARMARGEQMRPLTPSETLVLEELFSSDLSKSRSIEVNENGIQGTVSPRDLGMKPQQIMDKARARGMQKSQWYQQAAGGLH
ncbi:MAG: hypothetical protein ACHQ50_07450 [Fimbriimonadales bacterium]